MEAQIGALEAQFDKLSELLGTLERDVAVIKSSYATRADVVEARTSVIIWLVSAILLAQVISAMLEKFGI